MFYFVLMAPAGLSAEAVKHQSLKPESVKPEPPLGLSVPQALQRFGGAARTSLRDEFKKAGLTYPPTNITLIGLKKERLVCVYAGAKNPTLICKLPLATYSGQLGPKLREGDLQIPEGVYKITGMQASFRLALCVDYPNKTDKLNAAADKRTSLGGNILIHNGTHSTGCLVLSMDDMAQIFTAASDIGCKNITLIIAPCNLIGGLPDIDLRRQPKWLPAVYANLKTLLAAYPGL